MLLGAQPIERGHHNHRPGGTSQAWVSPAISGECYVRPAPCPTWNERAITPDASDIGSTFWGDGGPVPSSCLCVWPVAAPRPSARANASFDAAAYWPPRRDRFAVGDRPIQRYGLWHPSRPTACAVALGPDRHHLMRRFGNGTDRSMVWRKEIAVTTPMPGTVIKRCVVSSALAICRTWRSTPHQALCRRSHLVTMSELSPTSSSGRIVHAANPNNSLNARAPRRELLPDHGCEAALSQSGNPNVACTVAPGTRARLVPTRDRNFGRRYPSLRGA